MKTLPALLLALLVFTNRIFAQETTSSSGSSTTAAAADSSVKKERSYFTVGVQYLSDNVYYGRKDSVRIPYVTPRIAYYHRSGLYATGSASLLTSTGNTRIDAGTVTAGYQFSLGNFDGDISASKYFYNGESQNVRAEIEGNIDVNASYDFGEVISMYLDGALNIGDVDDYSAMLSIDHVFYLMNDHLGIEPAVSARAGTSHFYESYFNIRNLNRQRTRKGKPLIVADIHDAAKFNILSYECSAPVFYTIKKLTLMFNPVYAIPVHPAVISLTVPSTGASRTNTEQLSNQFYWSAGFSYKF